jgi:hypothetical protein
MMVGAIWGKQVGGRMRKEREAGMNMIEEYYMHT